MKKGKNSNETTKRCERKGRKDKENEESLAGIPNVADERDRSTRNIGMTRSISNNTDLVVSPPLFFFARGASDFQSGK